MWWWWDYHYSATWITLSISVHRYKGALPLQLLGLSFATIPLHCLPTLHHMLHRECPRKVFSLKSKASKPHFFNNLFFIPSLSPYGCVCADDLCRWFDLLPAACVQHQWAGDLSISQKETTKPGMMCAMIWMASTGRASASLPALALTLFGLRAEEARERIHTAFCCLKSFWLIAAGSGPFQPLSPLLLVKFYSEGLLLLLFLPVLPSPSSSCSIICLPRLPGCIHSERSCWKLRSHGTAGRQHATKLSLLLQNKHSSMTECMFLGLHLPVSLMYHLKLVYESTYFFGRAGKFLYSWHLLQIRLVSLLSLTLSVPSIWCFSELDSFSSLSILMLPKSPSGNYAQGHYKLLKPGLLISVWPRTCVGAIAVFYFALSCQSAFSIQYFLMPHHLILMWTRAIYSYF